MANPFVWFRRQEKIALAVLAIAVIIVFVLSDSLQFGDRDRRGSGGGSELVSLGNGQTMPVGEFRTLLQNNRAASRLTMELAQIGAERRRNAGKPYRGPRPMRLAMFSENPEFESRELRMLVAVGAEAKRHKIDFTDEEVVEYLRHLADEASSTEVANVKEQVLGRKGGGGKISDASLFDAIRNHLRVEQYLALAISGVSHGSEGEPITTPGQAWDMFQRLNRKVLVEALAVETAPFEKEVKGNPSETELNEIYEAGKEFAADDPGNPNPGFVATRQLAFQFVTYDEEKLLAAEMAKIDEADVRREYGQRAERKDPAVMETVPVGQPKTESGEGAPPSDPAATTDGAPSADATPETGKKIEEPKSDTPATEAPKGDSPKSGDTPPKTDGKQSRRSGVGPYFTALQEETPKGEGAANEEAKPAAKPADEAAKPAETSAAEASAPGSETPKPEPPKAPKTETRVKAYEDVAQDLRRRMALLPTNKIQQQISEAVDEALRTYAQKRTAWELKVKTIDPTKEKLEEPKIRDVLDPAIKQWADLDVQVQVYPLLDQFAFAQKELAAVQMTVRDQQFNMQSLEYLYGVRDLQMYKATEAPGPGRKIYIFWISGEKAPRLLARDEEETRTRLKQAWTNKKAAALAAAAAEKLAKQAAEALRADPSKSLAAALETASPEGAKFVTTTPFSWKSVDMMSFLRGAGGRPETSKIPEIPNVNDEFMKVIHNLAPGECGVAANANLSVHYVVKVVSETPSTAEMREDFLRRGQPERQVKALNVSRLGMLQGEWLQAQLAPPK